MTEFYSKKTVIPMRDLAKPDMAGLDYYPRKDDLLYYELGIRDGEESISLWVFPEIGFKSGGLTFRGRPVESNDPALLPMMYLSAQLGSFIPYPTPNRVRGGAFTFGGETVRMEKYGKPRASHGLAYDSVWSFSEPVIRDDGVGITGWFDIAPGDENYSAFPYHSRITAEYHLTRNALRFSYRVDNLGEKPMPYGICRHPDFLIPPDGERIEILVPAEDIYETTPDLLPTGRLLPVGDSPGADLRAFQDVRGVRLDTVFTHLGAGGPLVRYPERGYQMRICPSEEFRHVVVFTTNGLKLPEGMPNIFCIENQTCCTDGINMYAGGFPESGLIVLGPGESNEGRIDYCFEPLPV